MRALGLVELQRTHERLQHGLRDAAQVAALEPRVVVDADAGEERDLLTPEARHTPVPCRRSAGPPARGVILARLEVRNSRISLLVSTTSRVAPHAAG